MQTDNLIRSRFEPGAAEMRSESTEDGVMFGHFSVFDTWTEIDSYYEGRFLERVGSSAFDLAFRDKSKIKVLYDHGKDPMVGNKPLGSPEVLRADGVGAYHETALFTDASYVQDLMPALRAKQLGASFRFKVLDDEWVEPRSASDHNPNRLPERTIRSVALYEYGPVTFGAYPDAGQGVRSGTDSFVERLLSDPLFLARVTERAGLHVVEQILAGLPDDVRSPAVNTDAAPQGTSGATPGERAAFLRSIELRDLEVTA